MLYLGAMPEFEEFGPYSYREFDNFSEPVYDQLMEVPGSTDGSQFNAVKAMFEQ